MSVLDRPAKASDRLPPALVNSGLASHLDNPASARLALSTGGTNVFVARGRNGTLCLIMTSREFAATCTGRDLLRDGAIYLTTPEADGTMDVYAAVPDGFAEATAGSVNGAVSDNAVWLHGVPLSATTLYLTGRSGSRVVALGLQTPPA